MTEEQILASYWMKASDVIKNLKIENVINFLNSLGIEPQRIDGDDDEDDITLICPTICHNPLHEAINHKLYYYHKNKVFHCYTQCGENLSIFELYKRFHELNTGEEIDFREAISYVKLYLNLGEIWYQNILSSQSISLKDRYKKTSSIIELPSYPKYMIDIFQSYYHPSWIAEGITPEVMNKFNIRFYLKENKIIIPHYDISNRLIGIRTRAFEDEDIQYGKYMPLTFGKITYKHKLAFNLYGIMEHQKAIKRFKRVVIVESEKSTLLDDVFYGENSVAVACCGSSINKYQIKLLTSMLGVNEITIAFDRDWVSKGDEDYQKCVKKWRSLCMRYGKNVKMSYIIDNGSLLGYKDSPHDRGKETFEQLYKKRVRV